MNFISADTTAEADQVHVETLRRLDPLRRLVMAMSRGGSRRFSSTEHFQRDRQRSWVESGKWAKELGVTESLEQVLGEGR